MSKFRRHSHARHATVYFFPLHAARSTADEPALMPLPVEVKAPMHAIAISSQNCQNDGAGTTRSRRTAVGGRQHHSFFTL